MLISTEMVTPTTVIPGMMAGEVAVLKVTELADVDSAAAFDADVTEGLVAIELTATDEAAAAQTASFSVSKLHE